MIRIFDIPIYALSEKEFYDKREKLYEKNCKSITNSDSRVGIKQMIYQEHTWRYNQIVGYISISVDSERQDIVFEVYGCCDRIYTFSKNKRNIRNLMTSGLHFRYEGYSNTEIKSKIKSFLGDIKKDIYPRRYMDLEIFDNTIDFIDFKKFL